MINRLVYQAILEYVDNPKYLYHGSSIQNLKVLGPDSAVTSHDYAKAGKLIKRLYAADEKRMAAAFTFQWNDSMGIKFGWWESRDNMELGVPKKLLHLLENKCSIYTVSPKYFTRSPSGFEEYYTIQQVKVISEEKFNSSREALTKYKCAIRIL